MAIMLISMLQMLVCVLPLTAIMWLLLLPAILWGKCVIPRPELGRLFGRSAKVSIGIGLPLMFGACVLFARMNPERLPSRDLIGRSAGVAVAWLPLYGALVTTSIFQTRHKTAFVRGEARPFVVRLISGTVILVTNLFALMVMFFGLFASTGAYRGLR